MVRAKFKVDAVRRTSYTSGYEKKADGSTDYGRPLKVELHSIELSPVYGNGDPHHENTKFWEATPSGKLELGTINPVAAAAFELGKEYYVDFTLAQA